MTTTPIDLLTSELTDSIRVSATVRQILKTRLRQIRSRMRDPVTPPGELAHLSEEAVTIVGAMTNSIDRISKLLLGPKGPGTGGGDDPTTEEILAELTKGKRT